MTEGMVLSVSEALALLGHKLSKPSFYHALHNNQIPGAIQIGRRFLISKSKYEQWLSGQPANNSTGGRNEQA